MDNQSERERAQKNIRRAIRDAVAAQVPEHYTGTWQVTHSPDHGESNQLGYIDSDQLDKLPELVTGMAEKAGMNVGYTHRRNGLEVCIELGGEPGGKIVISPVIKTEAGRMAWRFKESQSAAECSYVMEQTK